MLARKINRGKWASRHYLGADDIRADAITGCLKTTDDKLSLWRCKDDPHDLDQVVLALATASKTQGFDRMDIVVLPENDIKDAGLTAEPMEGDTAVQDLRTRHVDLVHLDLDKLGTFARIISTRIRSSQVVRRTAKQVETLVREAVSSCRVHPDELNEELRQKLDINTGPR